MGIVDYLIWAFITVFCVYGYILMGIITYSFAVTANRLIQNLKHQKIIKALCIIFWPIVYVYIVVYVIHHGFDK